MDDADLDMVVRGTLFASVGTQGQRCTTARRLFLHQSVYDNVLDRLKKAYLQVKVGDPLTGICSFCLLFLNLLYVMPLAFDQWDEAALQ